MIKYTQAHIDQLNKQIKEHFPHLMQITPDMKTTRESVSRMVMLDRYANKDYDLKTLEVGDLIVAKIKEDPKFPTMGIGFITNIEGDDVKVKIDEEYASQIDPAHNPVDGVITIGKHDFHKPMEIFYEQIALRVATHLSEDEVENTEQYRKDFFEAVASDNLVPAGRVLYGAGSNTNVTYFNCFVLPMPHDSRTGISKHRSEAIEIMSRGGGVGTNGSTLRPKGAIAKTIGGKSSGAVSWLNDLATLTDLIQQGGSRRGAQMIMLQDWHPDVIEFIISKMQNPKILKWIADNFKHPEIVAEANRKLKFKPYSQDLKDLYNKAIEFATTEEEKDKYRKLLELGGDYEVNSPQFLAGANISIGITKDFMDAVAKGGKYQLRYPDILNMSKEEKELYDNIWQEMGDVREWDARGHKVKVYHEIDARELFDLINFCATYSAEPGVFFIDEANEMTNAKAYGQKVVCTNPCGEQPLAPYSVCNLAAINLANMINKETKDIDWDKLTRTVQASVRMQDNIIDKTSYFLDENRKQALGERRVGMGVMGLHDLILWKEMRYGSKESLELIDKIFEHIATTAYITSAKLTKEKGAFGFQKDVDSLLNTGYIQKLPQAVKDVIVENGGLRNSHLLTIAPTGSTGTMVGVSTGLEPYFAFKYYRSGRLGKFMEVEQDIVREWKEATGFSGEKLPEFFVSAMDITPEEHVDVQTTIQRWIDSSISKTVNAPKGYTVKQVEGIYMRLYENGAKGGTVYVDGSRDAQVLSITNEDNDVKATEIHISESYDRKVKKIQDRLADVPNNKQDRKMGTDLGDICPVCKEGTVEDLGGCVSCTHCGAQLKCGL